MKQQIESPCPFRDYGVGPANCPYMVNGVCDEIDVNPGNSDSFCGTAVEAQMNAADSLSKLADITKRVESAAEGLEGIFERREKTIHIPEELKKEFEARGMVMDEATGALAFDALQGSQQPGRKLYSQEELDAKLDAIDPEDDLKENLRKADEINKRDFASTKVLAAYESNNAGAKTVDVHGRTYRQTYEKFGHAAMVTEYLTTNSWFIK